MGGSSKKVTVGYRYYLGVHMILCHGPIDSLMQVLVDKRVAWSGGSSGGSFYISANDLFGGESREGGVSGTVDFENGGPAQGQNSYLVSQLGSLIPSFRGVAGMVLRQCYLGINPYLKPWSFRAKRVHTRQNGLEQWYDSKAEIAAPTTRAASFYESCSSLEGFTMNPLGVPGAIKTDGAIIYNDADEANNSTTATRLFSEKIFVERASFDVQVTQGNAGDAMRLALLNYAGSQIFQFFPRVENSADAAHRPALNSQDNMIGTTALQVSVWYSIVLDFDSTGCTITITNRNSGVQYASLRINGLLGSAIRGIRFVRDGDSGTNTASATAYDNVRVSGYLVIDDMNPAHIIRECLTDPDWGMGYQDADIDDTSFQSAADALYSENFGMSLLWDRQTAIEDFVKEVVRHIQASLYVDRTTGKFKLKLIRADYVEEDLIVLDESCVEKVDNFARPSFGDMVNSVTVNYWDSATNSKASISAQDTALVQMQGAVVGTTIQYPGCTNQPLAAKLATRDLRTLSTPLLSCTVYANRKASSLNIGDPFVLDWPDYLAEPTVMRVIGLAFGDGKSNKVKITCTEDAFSFPDVAIVRPEVTEWEDPSAYPSAAQYRVIEEAPYFELVQRLGQTTTDSQLATTPEIGYLLGSAAAPTAAINARMAVNAGAGYEGNDTPVDFCPVAFLAADLAPGATSVAITNGQGLSSVAEGTHAQIGEELVKVVSVTDSLLTIGRGVLDTVPAAHSSGEVVLFWDAFADSDGVEYVSGETVAVKLLPVSGAGALQLSEAAEDSLTFAHRAIRPYPPGNVLVNGSAYPSSILGTDALSLSWSHRDRVQQTAGDIVDTTYGNIGPEAGTTYTLRLYGETGSLLRTVAGLTGTSYNYTIANEQADSGFPPSGSVTPFSTEVLADSPYAYYRFEETSGSTASDSSTNARHGTYAGDVTKGVAGLLASDPSSKAAHFNPVNDTSQVDTGINANFTTAFTLAFIIKPDATQLDNSPFIISKSSYFAAAVTDFPVLVRYSSNGSVTFGLSKGDDFSTDLSLSSGSGTTPAGAASLVHLVYRANGLCELWVNGVLKASQTINFTVSTNTRNWMIGASAFANGGGVGNHRYTGVIDEVAIYNSALSSARIQAQAAASGLVAGAQLNGDLRFELEAVRDGYASYQYHNFTVSRAGYGYNYGRGYGQ